MFVAKQIRFPEMIKNRDIGIKGEELATDFLLKNGYRVYETNYRKPYGEIDIVAKKDTVIHFIEVKTSKYYPGSAFSPEIRVNARKIRNLKRICEAYLRDVKAPDSQKWQIDVIAVILDGEGLRGINFIENAVFERKY